MGGGGGLPPPKGRLEEGEEEWVEKEWEEEEKEEEEWEAASAESRLSFPVRGAGEDGGAVGPWRRSGTEVLLEMSDILKRVKDVFVDVGGLEGS